MNRLDRLLYQTHLAASIRSLRHQQIPPPWDDNTILEEAQPAPTYLFFVLLVKAKPPILPVYLPVYTVFGSNKIESHKNSLWTHYRYKECCADTVNCLL